MRKLTTTKKGSSKMPEPLIPNGAPGAIRTLDKRLRSSTLKRL